MGRGGGRGEPWAGRKGARAALSPRFTSGAAVRGLGSGGAVHGASPGDPAPASPRRLAARCSPRVGCEKPPLSPAGPSPGEIWPGASPVSPVLSG